MVEPNNFLGNRTTRAHVAIVIFTILSCIFVAWLAERNADQIRLSQWQACVGGVSIIERFNAQQQQLADVERRYQEQLNDAVPGISEERILVYEQGIIGIRDCGPQPR